MGCPPAQGSAAGITAAVRLGQNGAMNDDGVLVIAAEQYRRTRWRNGCGWTRAILALPAGLAGSAEPDWPLGPTAAADAAADEDWNLRLSIAEIDAAAAFSSFPGREREQILLSGNGLRLEFDDGERIELLPPHQRTGFDGARAVAGVPLDGPVQVFNLMWRADALAARLLHRPLVGGMWCFCDPHTAWAVHVLAGTARIATGAGGGAVMLEQGDSAWLAAGPGRRRHGLEGGGELLLVQVQKLPRGAGFELPLDAAASSPARSPPARG